MSKLKGVILSIENTILVKEDMDIDVFNEVNKLIRLLKFLDIDFVVLSNRHWRIHSTGQPLEKKLKEIWGDFNYYCSSTNDNIPKKPTTASVSFVLDDMGWENNEVVYIGSSDMDMRTAVNSNLLFLRATWFANDTEYGLPFSSPMDVARFINTFCLRNCWWAMAIEDESFRFYSLAPFSTFKEAYAFYSEDARSAAKSGQGHPEFWLSALVTSIYFTGLANEINYIAVYPGHKVGSGSPIMDETLNLFGKCFRVPFIPNLIERHTESVKSQTAKKKGLVADHKNQLNTIKLNKRPDKSNGKVYASSPLNKEKTVLLVDDICTRGHSIEAARAFISQTGAKVISVTWLKTINTDISRLEPFPKFNPYVANAFPKAGVQHIYGYHEYFTDQVAAFEIDKLFRAYTKWVWPEVVEQDD